ncbi:MAG: class I poly(R)-hydroxyalkanoic acid synthase, partial [Gammaproteobacteria bacterium]|nr:class I poly(R)-hydroxyalkanoic acid synthase [Gammaproteobacteria bacterium]
DLLYWNSDGTNMPAGIHRYVMRNFYLDNKLRESDALTLGGVSIDMKKVKTPTYVVATMEDHIAPWKTCYEVTQLFSGPVRFVLGESGHIAGVVNPPQKNRYGYWTNSKKHKSAQAWLESATRSPGSWWSDWNEWIGKYAGARVEPRDPAQGPLPVLGDAPGSYVLKTLD